MTSMSAITSGVTTVVTSFSTMVGDWAEIVTSEPLLLFFVCLPLVGIGIGLLKRLISL